VDLPRPSRCGAASFRKSLDIGAHCQFFERAPLKSFLPLSQLNGRGGKKREPDDAMFENALDQPSLQRNRSL